jgi:hypothetical protein
MNDTTYARAGLAGADLQRTCHDASRKAGWWTDLDSALDFIGVIHEPDSDLDALLGRALVGQKLCLIHSEISEAMEGHRKGLADDKLPHRPMIEVKLADAVIRIADLAGAMGLDLGSAITEKLAFNTTRTGHTLAGRLANGGEAY